MMRASLLAAILLTPLATVGWAQGTSVGTPVSYTVVGDAIPEPLTATPGDASRGRAIVANRSVGLCLLCHSGPIPEERFQGTLAPSLAGAGTRWSVAQLRLRIVDGSRLNPDTIMPPYYRTTGLVRVAKAFEGKTILTAEQIEDVVAYLATLKD
jgi:sulfur-oxidizing protein SoxX